MRIPEGQTATLRLLGGSAEQIECGAVITCDPLADFSIQRARVLWNEGTIYLVHPQTAAAEDWFADNIPDDAQQFGRALVVEHRFIRDLVAGITNDGLTVE